MSENACLMQAENIKKSFSSVEVLKGINLGIGSNEIIGLVGDNGAGKSTLIKILTGVHQPDNGELYWRGRRLTQFSASRARDLGIVTVFQDRALSEQHPIWRNIFMGRELTDFLGFIHIRRQKAETMKLMKEKMGFTSSTITPDTTVGTMSGGERQGVAISRALYFDADLIILDEPTTGLSISETRKVLAFVEQIRTSGKSCIFITHNLFHVYAVADRIVAMDRGTIVGDFPTSRISLEELENQMLEIAGTGEASGLRMFPTRKR